MSSMQMEMPALVAKRKPACSSLSAKTTVSFNPHLRNETLISLEISFFFNALFRFENGRPLGKISESSARPAVVSQSLVEGTNSWVSLSSVYSVNRTLMRALSSNSPASKARRTSPVSEKIRPSPFPLIRSRVV